MSTNPFRRSVLRDPPATSFPTPTSPATDSSTSAARPSDTPGSEPVSVPLTIDTRATNASAKHVNFASPPDFISPASYPSSPESTRNSLVLTPSISREAVGPGGYGALTADPFTEEPEDAEGHDVIEEALRNMRVNTAATSASDGRSGQTPIVPPRPGLARGTSGNKDDAVKNTLGRFAPRRSQSNHETTTLSSAKERKSLDVDAFKRLLLTGEAGAQTQGHVMPTSDSSSSTDTASLSQRSTEVQKEDHDTPRSSYEIERESESSTPRLSALDKDKDRRAAPPPPKPRHGRPISEVPGAAGLAKVVSREEGFGEVLSESTTATSTSTDLSVSVSDEKTEAIAEGSVKKRPPPPPLARRKSQKQTQTATTSTSTTPRPGIVRSPSSRYSMSESDEPMSPPTPQPTNAKMAPPPPPSRRPNPGQRRASVDLPATLEEDADSSSDEVTAGRNRTPPNSNSQRRPPPAPAMAPPLPPPRKTRGSNRSSMDSQRPALSTLGVGAGSARSSSEYGRNAESRNISSASTGSASGPGSGNAADILKDLAALQMEIDGARRSAGR
jgi:hypothetical protein